MVRNINRRNRVETSGQYVPRTAIEQSARTARDCALSHLILMSLSMLKKTGEQTKCPPMPDMKDYVLKSSIPPAQQCPACIAPRVKVSKGDLQRNVQSANSNAQTPNHVTTKFVRTLYGGPKEKKIPPCPECPAPEPCPTEPPKVCPAVRLPTPDDLKCLPPQPCPKEKCPPCKWD